MGCLHKSRSPPSPAPRASPLFRRGRSPTGLFRSRSIVPTPPVFRATFNGGPPPSSAARVEPLLSDATQPPPILQLLSSSSSTFAYPPPLTAQLASATRLEETMREWPLQDAKYRFSAIGIRSAAKTARHLLRQVW